MSHCSEQMTRMRQNFTPCSFDVMWHSHVEKWLGFCWPKHWKLYKRCLVVHIKGLNPQPDHQEWAQNAKRLGNFIKHKVSLFFKTDLGEPLSTQLHLLYPLLSRTCHLSDFEENFAHNNSLLGSGLNQVIFFGPWS